jgi:hypothetical protein
LAYNLLDLTSAVQDDLKDSSFNSTRIRRYLNHGQKIIFGTHEFKFTEKSVSGSLTIGEHTYEQQSDHEATIGGVLINPSATTSYWVMDETNYLGYREFFARNPDPSVNTNARPSEWTEFGDQIYFNCPVDKAYIFKQRYYRIPTDMTTDASVPDVPVTFRELLELWADYRGEKYRGNHDIAATYKQEFEDGLEAMAMRYGPVTSVGPTIARQTRVRV